MRMIALAQAWQDTGGQAVFLCVEIMPPLASRISAEGFVLVRIDAAPGSNEDLAKTCSVISHSSFNDSILALDGYHFNEEFQLGIKKTGIRLLAIDDYGHVAFYHADWVLNQNISAQEELYTNRSPRSEILLGSRFALLRREFLKHSGTLRNIPKIGSKVLVTLGGTDPSNVTGKVIKALAGLPLELKVIVGCSNPHFPELQNAVEIAASRTASIELIVNPRDVPNLMKWADLAVAAGGSTAWELAFMGVPTLYFILAANQHAVAINLEQKELGICLFDLAKRSEFSDLTRRVLNLSIDLKLREKLSANCRSAVDGYGARRVVEILKAKS